MAMSADLGSTLEKYVSKLVEEGRYNSKSEVLREGVRLVQDRESRLAVLDAAIAKGLAASKAGQIHSAEDVFSELEDQLEKLVSASDK